MADIRLGDFFRKWQRVAGELDFTGFVRILGGFGILWSDDLGGVASYRWLPGVPGGLLRRFYC